MSISPVELRSLPVGELEMNAYVLIDPTTRQSVLIDPGAEPEALIELLAGTTPVAILLTHSHWDHVDALEPVRERLQVPVLAHAGPYAVERPLPIDRTLAHGDTVTLGTLTLRAYHTPGHTSDMLSFEVVGTPVMLVGDTIFPGGPGDTDSPAAFQTTLQTLRDVVLSWPDATLCYPGHGRSFRLGDERAAIEQFLTRDHGAFFGDATWTMEALPAAS